MLESPLRIVGRFPRPVRLLLVGTLVNKLGTAFAVNPLIALPLHAALGQRLFWGLMPLVALPGTLVLLHLDRTADRLERRRGFGGGASRGVRGRRCDRILPCPPAHAPSSRIGRSSRR